MPTGLLTAAVFGGLALSAVGTAGSFFSQKEAASAQQDMTKQQLAIEAKRKQQMELEAKRNQLETLRQAQRARAVATASATNQGGLFGTGLQGGFGQISGQENTQLVSQGQNLQIGEDIFGLNSLLSGDKQRYASAQSTSQTFAGLTSLGGQLVNSAGAINRVGSTAFTNTNPYLSSGARNNSFYGPGQQYT